MADPEGRFFVVIMAGGSGTRFWPLSRKSRPKQLLEIFDNGTSLYNKSCERILPCLSGWEDIFVVTSGDYVEFIGEQTPLIPRENILLEPVGRNTAPCAGYAASVISTRISADSVMVLLPADHIVVDEENFRKKIKLAVSLVEAGKSFVTIGIRPDRAETGYGYIEKGKAEIFGDGVFSALRFVEKPDIHTAEKFLESGDYLWNAGIFVMKVSSLLNAFRDFLPEMYDGINSLGELSTNPKGWRRIENIFSGFESLSIDSGIMEKVKDLWVIESDIGWSDLGSWESFASFVSGQGKSFCGDRIEVKSSGNLIIGNKRLIALCGVNDLVIVDTGDALLVSRLDSSQDVRLIVEELKKKGKTGLL